MGAWNAAYSGCDFQVRFYYVCGITALVICRSCIPIGWNLVRRELRPLKHEEREQVSPVYGVLQQNLP
jgi:hypothetical protein